NATPASLRSDCPAGWPWNRWPDGRGMPGQMRVDWVAGWRGIRIEDPEDRRAVRVQATEAGADLYERIRADLIAEEKEMISGMPAEVRQGALTLLRQLTRAAEIRCGLVSECCPGQTKDK
ncbi:MarR family winged helix-turn-helix transcriptional regulator, partial [Pseudomonas aeruginosa]|uniref:MarR family winged helix-turn-helix transcriptional regulator n=1 Tax=Pseudomonas aeruginosa TaxID=287 RepID=UPI003965769F